MSATCIHSYCSLILYAHSLTSSDGGADKLGTGWREREHEGASMQSARNRSGSDDVGSGDLDDNADESAVPAASDEVDVAGISEEDRRLGQRVRMMRRERRMSVKELAQLASLSTGMVSQIERG